MNKIVVTEILQFYRMCPRSLPTVIRKPKVKYPIPRPMPVPIKKK